MSREITYFAIFVLMAQALVACKTTSETVLPPAPQAEVPHVPKGIKTVPLVPLTPEVMPDSFVVLPDPLNTLEEVQSAMMTGLLLAIVSVLSLLAYVFGLQKYFLKVLPLARSAWTKLFARVKD